MDEGEGAEDDGSVLSLSPGRWRMMAGNAGVSGQEEMISEKRAGVWGS